MKNNQRTTILCRSLILRLSLKAISLLSNHLWLYLNTQHLKHFFDIPISDSRKKFKLLCSLDPRTCSIQGYVSKTKWKQGTYFLVRATLCCYLIWIRCVSQQLSPHFAWVLETNYILLLQLPLSFVKVWLFYLASRCSSLIKQVSLLFA